MEIEMEASARKEQSIKDQNTMTWIVVLAIAITCCAILFVVFANYLVAINKNLSMANTRLTVMELNESQLLSEIQSLHRAMLANQPPKTPPATTPAMPPAPGAPPAPAPTTH